MNYLSLSNDGTVLKCYSSELSVVEVALVGVILSYPNNIRQLNFIFGTLHSNIGNKLKKVIELPTSMINHVTFLSEPLSFDYILATCPQHKTPLFSLMNQTMEIIHRITKQPPSYKIFSEISQFFCKKPSVRKLDNLNLIVAYTTAQIVSSSKLLSITTIINTITPSIISGITIGVRSKDSLLSSISLPRSNIDSVSLVVLLEGIKYSKTLRLLDIESNKIGDRGAIILSNLLLSNNTLVSLNISNNSIQQEGICQIFNILHSNTTLQALYIGANNLTENGGSLVREAIAHTVSLTHLSIYSLTSSISVMEDVMCGISRNSSLEYLDISLNPNSKKLIDSLTSILMLQQPPLNSIKLNKIGMSNCSATTIFSALIHNETLEQIEMASNNITSVGANKILQSIIANPFIYHLNLLGNEFNYYYYQRIEATIYRNSRNRFLKNLTLFTLLLNKLT